MFIECFGGAFDALNIQIFVVITPSLMLIISTYNCAPFNGYFECIQNSRHSEH